MKQNISTVYVNINLSLDASDNLSIDNLLQQKAISKIQSLIKLKLNKKYQTSKRAHDAITILGERGSGKTSLLLSLDAILKEYENELVHLRVIDPTLFETKQNILVSIISLISTEVQKTLGETSDNGERWYKKLMELADGLKLLDGIGSDLIKSDLFDDSALILDKGLSHAFSGLKLEDNFNDFLEESLNVLNKKMFVLVFDDIDTNIDKGWMVLEAIRKYLTSPDKLQIFISGDWNLYSSLVRIKQWSNFNKNILPYQEWLSKSTLVNDLEEQYLIKVLKPENRIYLQNFYHLTKQDNDAEIIIQDETNSENIKNIYSTISKEVFNINNNEDKKLLFDLLAKLPVRTNMKLFYTYMKNLNYENSNNSMIGDISSVFLTNTERFGFTHLDYEILSDKTVLQEMSKKIFTISDHDYSFSKLIKFPMNLSNKDINILLLVVNAHLTKTINSNIYIFFEWLTRINYLYFLESIQNKEDTKIDLLKKLQYDDIVPMRKQIDLISDTFELSKNNQKILVPGFRSTYAFDRQVASDEFLGIDKFLKNVDINEAFLLNVMMSKSGQVAHSEATNISLVTIFSFLVDFLQKNESEAKDFLLETFIEYSQGTEIEEDHLFDEQFQEELALEIKSSSLYCSLIEWHKLQSTFKAISLSQINNIWTNFLEKHTRSENNIQNASNINVKEFISTQIIVFLNAIVQEILYNKGYYKAYEAIYKTTNLYRNIHIAYKKTNKKSFYEEMDLFKFIYICPVFRCFLEDENFIKPSEIYCVNLEVLHKIRTSFSKLAIQGGKSKEKASIETDSFIYKYISKKDLKVITYKEVKSIEKIVEEIQQGTNYSRQELWQKIKPPKSRITNERESILDRFITNIKSDSSNDNT